MRYQKHADGEEPDIVESWLFFMDVAIQISTQEFTDEAEMTVGSEVIVDFHDSLNFVTALSVFLVYVFLHSHG